MTEAVDEQVLEKLNLKKPDEKKKTDEKPKKSKSSKKLPVIPDNVIPEEKESDSDVRLLTEDELDD